ncbi:MAG: histidine phosphatase family protein [Defluviitaleaceae bacterium]|nr:histidine phosphatase family protein [Defluviitaleaceae bacterium]
MKVYTARHGQTAWNLEGRMQGSIDIPLDATGINQAGKLAQRFKNIPLSAIFTSDLCRAAETANIINKYHGLEPVVKPALREISYGDFEGRLISDIGIQMQGLHKAGRRLPGGETIAEFFERIHSCLETILPHQHGDILIIGHGGTIRAMLCYFMGLPPDKFSSLGIGNTSVHCFERRADGTYGIVINNDTSHLEMYS